MVPEREHFSCLEIQLFAQMQDYIAAKTENKIPDRNVKDLKNNIEGFRKKFNSLSADRCAIPMLRTLVYQFCTCFQKNLIPVYRNTLFRGITRCCQSSPLVETKRVPTSQCDSAIPTNTVISPLISRNE